MPYLIDPETQVQNYTRMLDYGLKRFEIAASQRMQAVNFFMATVALLWGAAAATLSHHLRARIAILMVSSAVTGLFYMIEVRSKSFVSQAEEAMQKAGKALQKLYEAGKRSMPIATQKIEVRYGQTSGTILACDACVELFREDVRCGSQQPDGDASCRFCEGTDEQIAESRRAYERWMLPEALRLVFD